MSSFSFSRSLWGFASRLGNRTSPPASLGSAAFPSTPKPVLAVQHARAISTPRRTRALTSPPPLGLVPASTTLQRQQHRALSATAHLLAAPSKRQRHLKQEARTQRDSTRNKHSVERGRKMPGSKVRGKSKKGADLADPKIPNFKRTLALLSPDKLPPPLRMARNRYLRHWTIHRAWMLWLRRQREGELLARERQYRTMWDACEALRLSDGPARRPEGWMYAVAMEKVGVWDWGAVPIEYARAQTETPGKRPWDHDWKRD